MQAARRPIDNTSPIGQVHDVGRQRHGAEWSVGRHGEGVPLRPVILDQVEALT